MLHDGFATWHAQIDVDFQHLPDEVFKVGRNVVIAIKLASEGSEGQSARLPD
jgi:hypothetical protein